MTKVNLLEPVLPWNMLRKALNQSSYVCMHVDLQFYCPLFYKRQSGVQTTTFHFYGFHYFHKQKL